MTPDKSDKSKWVAGSLLAAMPLISSILQYSLDRGPDYRLFQHLTVTYVDWVFVPFNLLVVHTIDWRRGGTLFAITVLSVVGNTAAHAIWQNNLIEIGYMFSADRVFLPAGWVHLIYSTLQMILLLAFVFCRRNDARFAWSTTILAVVYFLAAGVCGYSMNHGFIVTDVIMVLCGLFGVLIYPRLDWTWASADTPAK